MSVGSGRKHRLQLQPTRNAVNRAINFHYEWKLQLRVEECRRQSRVYSLLDIQGLEKKGEEKREKKTRSWNQKKSHEGARPIYIPISNLENEDPSSFNSRPVSSNGKRSIKRCSALIEIDSSGSSHKYSYVVVEHWKKNRSFFACSYLGGANTLTLLQSSNLDFILSLFIFFARLYFIGNPTWIKEFKLKIRDRAINDSNWSDDRQLCHIYHVRYILLLT